MAPSGRRQRLSISMGVMGPGGRYIFGHDPTDGVNGSAASVGHDDAAIERTIASVKELVPPRPPTSSVRTTGSCSLSMRRRGSVSVTLRAVPRSTYASSRAASMRSAASCSSRYLSIIVAVAICDVGLARSLPARSGADHAPARTGPGPGDPIRPAPRSEIRSPNRFGHKRTSLAARSKTSLVLRGWTERTRRRRRQ